MLLLSEQSTGGTTFEDSELDVKLLGIVLAEFHGMMQNWVETSSLHDLSVSAQSHICDVGW